MGPASAQKPSIPWFTVFSGWIPLYFTHDDYILPSFIKFHSDGEYIFDWAWADFYKRVGINYYPKEIFSHLLLFSICWLCVKVLIIKNHSLNWIFWRKKHFCTFIMIALNKNNTTRWRLSCIILLIRL